MKQKYILAIVPALALFAVSCSTPTAMQSTEYDDMYYTSSDKTEYIQPEATAQASETSKAGRSGGGVINPEYSDNSAVINDYDGDEYYDGRTYDPRDNWYQPAYSYVDPYWGSAYAPSYARHYNTAMVFRDPFYSPYAGYDPFFYDSFYSSRHNPYWRNGVTVSIAFGSVWNDPFYWGNPYSHNYYSAWYPYNNYYNGYHHGYRNGFNNGFYNNRNQYVYRPEYVSTRKVQYGPRTERSSLVSGDSRGAVLGRPDRGTLSSDNGQEAVRGSEGRPRRPSRTGEVSPNPGGEDTKEVITTRPGTNGDYYDGRSRQARPQRGTAPVVGEQERSIPVEGARPSRTRGEYTPARETRQQPVRQQEARPSNERRERSAPVRVEPVRSERSETRPVRVERSENRPAPSRSESSGSGSSGSSEQRGGGRPSRGN